MPKEQDFGEILKDRLKELEEEPIMGVVDIGKYSYRYGKPKPAKSRPRKIDKQKIPKQKTNQIRIIRR